MSSYLGTAFTFPSLSGSDPVTIDLPTGDADQLLVMFAGHFSYEDGGHPGLLSGWTAGSGTFPADGTMVYFRITDGSETSTMTFTPFAGAGQEGWAVSRYSFDRDLNEAIFYPFGPAAEHFWDTGDSLPVVFSLTDAASYADDETVEMAYMIGAFVYSSDAGNPWTHSWDFITGRDDDDDGAGSYVTTADRLDLATFTTDVPALHWTSGPVDDAGTYLGITLWSLVVRWDVSITPGTPFDIEDSFYEELGVE